MFAPPQVWENLKPLMPPFLLQLQHRINRNDLPESSARRMKKTLSGSTPQLVHHGVAALKFSEAELARRAIVAKYLSPPPAALTAHDANKVSTLRLRDVSLKFTFTKKDFGEV